MPDAPSPKPICPFCGSADTMPIVYGLPGPELFEASMRGEVALGGCCIEPGFSRNRRCHTCQYEWISEPI